jgi:predicted TIM-barrel fold metal-dependent hydrolase
MIIDVHGHYTTAPKALEAWRNRQIAGINNPAEMPKPSELHISDDELRESIEGNRLRLMRERGLDLTIFSPRASFMAHHIGDFEVSSTWSAICNELCYRVSKLFPDHFIPAAMLPQSPGVDPATCVSELVKCVEEYGNVAINLNPDSSGGHWSSPPLSRHRPLTRVIPVNNILFASEMIGAVRGVDPQTGHYFDDTRRYVEAAHIDARERHKIYEGNARRVYPRLDAALKAKGR